MRFAIRLMQSLTVMALVGLCGGAAMAAAPVAGTEAASVVGFQDWKNAKIEEAKAALDKAQLERNPPSAKAEAVKPGQANRRLQKSPRSDQKLQQAQATLEIAKELTVTDYFVLYLSQFKDRESFIEAAKRLTPEESAEIMLAYQRQLVNPEPVEIVVPNSGALSGSRQ